MNFTFKKVTVCLLIIFSVFLFYKNADAVKPCDVDASEDCEYEAVYISVSDLKTKIDAGEKNLAILDVRQGVEYVDAHIQGALSLPLSDVKKNAEAKVAKDKEIVTYCSATECQASLSAAKKLHDLGYRNIKILEGGFPAWENEGYKVNSGWEDDRTFAKGGLTSESIALGTVIGIGLADGVNPCAIGMLVFLLGYLIVFAGRRKDVPRTGVVYIAVVFATYFIVGLLFYRVLVEFSHTSRYAAISNLIHLVLGGILIIAGAINVKDFAFYGVGPSLEISKKVRPFLQRWVSKTTLLSTVVLAVLVTIFEVPCSLPLYAGVLDVLSRSDVSKVGIVGYLGLYNFLFVLPLIVILILVWSGKKMVDLKEWEHRSKKWMKLSMGVILIGFGIWMLLT
ncbi:MAG: cytochrome c biogenesis protein, transmembrane region [uncultured bacterium]|nr:MAG: cytochrome c biogenesis protein, transmembrane region [uncultured bacterium]